MRDSTWVKVSLLLASVAFARAFQTVDKAKSEGFPRLFGSSKCNEKPCDKPLSKLMLGNVSGANQQPQVCLGRRKIISLTAASLLTPVPAMAQPSVLDLVTPKAESAALDVGLLESRVTENLLSPPPYGMEVPDVYYPSWMAGTWQIASTTKDVIAPCGVSLFGGNATYQKAKSEVGTTLVYDARFVQDGFGHIVADREFNVKSIARVAMGDQSVVDVSQVSPNKFSCLLAPTGAPSMLNVDLLVLNRRQETISDTQFDCSEVMREIVSFAATRQPTSPILKEVETTSLYTFVPETSEIRVRQRSASFLVPSQGSDIAMRMWVAAKGRPTDVRFYDVVYTKKR